jgi:tetratricopeptide (TPR) repeat protein
MAMATKVMEGQVRGQTVHEDAWCNPLNKSDVRRRPRSGRGWRMWLSAGALCWFLAGCVSLKEMEEANTLARGDLGQKIQAVALYNAAIQKAPSAGRRREIEALQRSLKGEIASSAVQVADQAKGKTPTVTSLDLSISLLEKYVPYDDDSGRIKAALESVRQARQEAKAQCDRNLALAKTAEESKRWTEAIVAMEAAAKLDPKSVSAAAETERLVKARNEYYDTSLKATLSREDLGEARRLLEAFLAEKPAPASALVQEIRKNTETTSDKIAARSVSDCVRSNKFYTAFKLLANLYDRSAVPNADEITKRGAAFYLQRAREECAQSNRFGFAYFAAVKALEMNPNDAATFAVHRDYSDAMEKLIRVQIAISGFETPAKEPDSGNQFSDALIAHLVERLPYGVKILERRRIDEVLREKGRQLKELSEELKVEMFIVGNVSALQVERQRTENNGTVVIAKGTKKEPNPEYNLMMMQYGPNLKKWPRQPAATLDSPDNQVVTYKMGREKVSGLMVVSVRIFDAAKADITVAKEFKLPVESEGEFNDAVPDAKIAAKNLNVPSDLDLKEKMRLALVKNVAEVVLKAYEFRENRFWTSADWLLGRQEYDKAVLELARGYYYCTKDKESLPDKEKNAHFLKLADAGLLKYTD